MRKCYAPTAVRRVLFLFSLLLCISGALKAQFNFPIGTGTAANGTTTYPCPLQDFYEGSRSQYLYLASELTAAGMTKGYINAISFNVIAINTSTTGPLAVEGYTLKIGTTATASLGTGWESGATVVYGPFDYTATTGINTFTFTSPFFWDGVNNVFIEICNGNGSGIGTTTFTNNNQVAWTTGLPFSASRTFRSDAPGAPNNFIPCDTTTATENGTQANRPNIVFNHTSTAPCTSPNAGTLSSTLTSNVCAGVPFTLKTVGTSVGGYNYVWQDSSEFTTPPLTFDGWQDIPASVVGLNVTNFTTTQTVTTKYRLVVACATTNEVVMTNAVLVTSPVLPSGIFTIDKNAPASSTNFTSFTAAYNSLITCGIKGPVLFNVIGKDAGGTPYTPYNEQLTWKRVAGTSDINTITFKGDGAATVSFSSTNTNKRGVFTFDSTTYVTLDSLTIDASAGTYGYGVHFLRYAHHNTIKNCIIKSSVTNTTINNFGGLVFSSTATGLITTLGLNYCDYNNITDNVIEGGYFGVAHAATPDGASGYNTILRNDIKEFHTYGIYANNAYNTTIEKNIIHRPTRTANALNFYGIYIAGNSSVRNLISKNKIYDPYGATPSLASSNFYGITLDNVVPSSLANFNRIFNNVVAATSGNGIVYGIQAIGTTSYVSIIYNTISIDSVQSTSTAASRGLFVQLPNSGFTIYNNLITIRRGGTGTKHCIYFGTAAVDNGIIFCDYNNYYINSAAGSNNIGFSGTNKPLFDPGWKGTANLDKNSFSVDPLYVDPQNFYFEPDAASMDNQGRPFNTGSNAVTSDILDQPRGNIPDIGAYNYVPPGCTTPPNPGKTIFGSNTSTDTTICQNTYLRLSLKNPSYGFTQTYKWESSKTNSPYLWQDVLPTVSTDPEITILADTSKYYRCVVTCNNIVAYSDTLHLNVTPALQGNFDIDTTGTIASGPYAPWRTTGYFKSFNAARLALKVCGTSGPCTFTVKPGSGPYVEQLILDNLSGSAFRDPNSFAGYPITFKGSLDTIRFINTTANEKAIIKIKNSNFITVDSLIIDARSVGTSGGFGVHLLNNSDTNTVKNCVILASQTATSNTYAGIALNTTDATSTTAGAIPCDDNIFENNTISGGFYGFSLVGSTTAPALRNVFKGNTVTDFYNTGVNIGAGNAFTLISSNSLSRPTRPSLGTLTITGINVSGTVITDVNITKNRIFNLVGGTLGNTGITTYGINHANVNSVVGSENYVTNNLLYNFNGAGPVYGISNNTSAYVRYFNNTIAIDSASNTSTTTARGFYQTGTALGIQFKNNIVTVNRGGNGAKHAIYLATTASGIESNYNDFYVNTNAGGTQNFVGFYNALNLATLPNWLVTTKDSNSISYDPGYTSPATGNYAPTIAPVDDKGTFVPNVIDDILGNPRVFPDMGAYEFSVPNCGTPPPATTATIDPPTGLCVDNRITLDVPGSVSALGRIYVWYNGPSATGPWTRISDTMYFPQFNTLAKANPYYYCRIICNGSPDSSTVVMAGMNLLLKAGEYFIDADNPTNYTTVQAPGANFNSFADAVQTMNCGITGSIVFRVKQSAINSGVYNEQVYINKVPGSGVNATITFTSFNSNPNSVNLTYNSVSSNYVLKIDTASYVTFKDLTITQQSASLARVVDFGFMASYDSLIGCKIVTQPTTNSANTTAAVTAITNKGSNLVIKGNNITNGSSGVYITGTSATALSSNHVVDSNTISGTYYYGIYTGFTNRTKVNNNTVNLTSPLFGNATGIYASNSDTAYRIIGNTININNSNVVTYGIYLTNCKAVSNDSGIVAANKIIAASGNTGNIYGITNFTATKENYTINNAVAIASSGATAYGIYNFGATDIMYINNSVNISSGGLTTGYAFYVSNTVNSNVRYTNNIFSNKAGGRALYLQAPAVFTGTGNYNMLYSNGTTLIGAGSAPTTYANTGAGFQLWRTNSYNDRYSIATVAPAFVSNTDLTPDVTKDTVWAIHGRGTQMTTNPRDINNVARPVKLTDGAPDLGAYEFAPPAVLPPALNGVPAVPTAGVRQVFNFGTDTIMAIKWGTTVPPGVVIRRYSGVVPAGLKPTFTQDSMYFYNKVETSDGTTDYLCKIENFYIDPWQGSIPDQHQIGMGKSLPAISPVPWKVGFSSETDVKKKVIKDTTIDYLDKFTGLINPYAPPVLPDVDSSNRGKRFWVAYGHHQQMTATGGTQNMKLYFSTGDDPANIHVYVNGPGGTEVWARDYFVPANSSFESPDADVMPKAAGPDQSIMMNEGKYTCGIGIESDVPIAAYAHIYAATNSGATMLLPTGVYGYEYYSLNPSQYYASDCYSWFYVVADNDNTVVEITPSVTTRGGKPANVPFNVILNKGEVYQVMGTTSGATGTDMTGSKMRSVENSAGKCFPFAAFSGSSRTAICYFSNGDNVNQQIFPAQAWGKKFAVFATANENSNTTYNSNIYRVMVKDPLTKVYRNGQQLTGLIANRYYQFNTTNGSNVTTPGQVADYVEADKPIMMAQYMVSSGADECPGVSAPGNGDPEMIYVSPIEQGIKKVIFYNTTNNTITSNHLNLVIPQAGLASLSIRINNGPRLTTYTHQFNHPYKAGYVCIRQTIPTSKVVTSVESDSAFTAITYGLGGAESYGYNAGTLVKNLKPRVKIQNPLGSGDEFTCANTPFKFKVYLPLVPDSLKIKFGSVLNMYYYGNGSKPFTRPANDTTVYLPPHIPSILPSDTIIVNSVPYYGFPIDMLYTFTQAKYYQVPIIYYSPDIEGCAHSYEDTVPVKVVPSPKGIFTIAYPGGSTATSACEGDAVTFAANLYTENADKLKAWAWKFYSGVPDTADVQFPAPITYPTAGTFDVRMTGITDYGCVGDTTQKVVINPKPIVTVVADTVFSCPGKDTAFYILNPVTGVNYSWYNSISSTTPLPNTDVNGDSLKITAPLIFSDTARYYAEGQIGPCLSVVRKEVLVITPAPLAAPTIVSPPTFGTGTVTFTWNTLGNATGYDVSTDGTTWIDNGNVATYTVNNVAYLQQVCLKVRAKNNCGFGAESAQVCVCMPGTLVAAPTDTTVCPNSPITFSIQNPATTGVTYNWYDAATGGNIVNVGATFATTAPAAQGANTSYYVEAVSATCAFGIRTPVTVRTFTQLAAPAVTATVGTGTVTFNWNTIATATGYEISLDAGTTWISTGTLTTYTATAGALQTVCAIVRAIGTQTCLTSNPSTSVCGCYTAITITTTPNNVTLCAGSTAPTFTIQSPAANVTYNWFTNATGAGTPVFTGIGAAGAVYTPTPLPNGTTTYYVVGVSTSGCSSAPQQVAVLNVLPILPLAQPAFTTTLSTPTTLTVTWDPVAGATSYDIVVNGTTYTGVTSPYTITGLTPFLDVTVVIKANAANPCQSSSSAPITGKTLPDGIYIPNAFTPNGDGQNDHLAIYTYLVKTAKMQIFNQWGEKVYEGNENDIVCTSANCNKGWDGKFKGKFLPVGVYVYIVKVATVTGENIERKGSINLVR